MAIIYTWRVQQLKCAPKVGNKVNVVKSIPYDYIGVDENGVEAISSGNVTIPDPGDTWITYTQLKQSDIEGWLEANLNVDTLKNKIEAEINKINNPTIVDVEKPW